VRSLNKWSWGALSSVLQVKASTWPAIVEMPLTSIDQEDGDLLISWQEPDPHSSEIQSYFIEIED
jgi:hypothetical protein